MTTGSSDEHTAGKPLAVKIVEWLGWMYVALGVVTLILVVGGFWGYWGIVNPVQAGIWCLTFPVGLPLCLVWALRQGSRGWFLWPHSVVVGYFTLGVAVAGSPWAIVAAVLLVVPFVLLFTPAASRWFKERLAGQKKSKWKISAQLPIFLLMGAIFLAMAGGALPPLPVWRYNSAVRGAKVLHRALVENENRRKAGQSWVDPSLHEDSESFLMELSKMQDDKDVSSDMRHAYVVVPWCIAVDPPDDECLPIVCTANINPADLLRPAGDRRPATLACPGGSHHLVSVEGRGAPHEECDGFCDRAALAVAGNGEIVFVRSFLSAPSMFSPEKVPQTGTVRYLTPTGCIDIVIHK